MTEVSVTDEQLGKLSRKQFEIYRRVREGSLNPDWLLGALQNLIENGRGLAAEKALADLTQKITEITADLQVKKSYNHLFTLTGSPDDKTALLAHLSQVDARWTDSSASAWALAEALNKLSRIAAHFCSQVLIDSRVELPQEKVLKDFCSRVSWADSVIYSLWEWLRIKALSEQRGSSSRA
jgi:hypothetical protein